MCVFVQGIPDNTLRKSNWVKYSVKICDTANDFKKKKNLSEESGRADLLCSYRKCLFEFIKSNPSQFLQTHKTIPKGSRIFSCHCMFWSVRVGEVKKWILTFWVFSHIGEASCPCGNKSFSGFLVLSSAGDFSHKEVSASTSCHIHGDFLLISHS